jgi:hypothetical protein
MTARNPTGRSELTTRVRAAAAWLALLAPALALGQVDADALRACTAEKNDARRLECYDQAMSVRKQAPAVAPAVAAAAAPEAKAAAAEPKAAAPAVAGASPDAEAKFGYRGAIARQELDEQAQRESGGDRIEAGVVEVARRARGELVLTLDNGQVWAQKAADSSRVKVGDRVTIKKASFGSFLLVFPNNRTTRVTREK